MNVDEHRNDVRYQRAVYRVGNYDIPRESFRRLRCEAEHTSELWLNDIIIDAFLWILKMNAADSNYFFTSFLYIIYSKVSFLFFFAEFFKLRFKLRFNFIAVGVSR